ncbi:hypothetical protein FACS1894199_02350 [Bacteroidia bacterium]|nr:hypothetical protein FACS1894199_02350 [Bacteroidia bacterium]
MKNKISAGVLFTLSVLLVIVVSELAFDRHSAEDVVKKVEQRLQKQERLADNTLAQFQDSTAIDPYNANDGVNTGANDDDGMIILGLRGENIFFWTNENLGVDNLYHILSSDVDFAKINNSYYEIRRLKHGHTAYFALLRIKDDYPYTNKYIQNHFGKFLGMTYGDAKDVEISPEPIEGGTGIRTIDGTTLFYLKCTDRYKDNSVNYILLCIHILFFVGLFYVYSQVLQNAPSLKRQLLSLTVFVALLGLLHFCMCHFSIPNYLYRLNTFDPGKVECVFAPSIGDLMVFVLNLVLLLYITFAKLKVNYSLPLSHHFRYLSLGVLLLLILAYAVVFVHIIDTLIEGADVHLNIVRIMEVDMPSIIVFFSFIVAGLGLIIFIDGTIHIMKFLIPLRTLLIIETVFFTLATFTCFALKEPIFAFACLLTFFIFTLLVSNCYVKRRDAQRILYLFILFLLALFIVFVEKHFEQQRELIQRMHFAQELLQERDPDFELELLEIDQRIKESDTIKSLVSNYKEEILRNLLTTESHLLTGFSYTTTIILCGPDDILNIRHEGKLYHCNEYFDAMISKSKMKIGTTNFYLINEFDGVNSYIGKYEYGKISFIIRFDSTNESEGQGYPQILSRRRSENAKTAYPYPYSYAKYKNGDLMTSSGLFNYYKSVAGFGNVGSRVTNKMKVGIFELDEYSHLFLSVDDGNTLVVSLSTDFFSIYYLNILYVFFICIILSSSYGLFFNLQSRVRFKKGSLKESVKNNILSLMLILFILLTLSSILLMTKNYEKRHYVKLTELIQNLNRELEEAECVESSECPEILSVLSRWSEVFSVDINIYTERGRLTATSRPEIFATGFSGYLVDPMAYKRIINERSTAYVCNKKIGELPYLSAYVPLQLENKSIYILNVPYFTQNDDLSQSIFILVMVMMNIALVVMGIAYILAGVIANRVTKPLRLVNNRLKQMHIGGKNEKIDYHLPDEVGELVMEYNNMVEKLDENVQQLARSERETAWREMARQIAHEIKNPLTPMKLNIQFMQRSLQITDTQEFKDKFKNVSALLIEQIDNMASIASAFSDFAKISEAEHQRFDIGELLLSTAKLFEPNVDTLETNIAQGIFISADKVQIHRVFINILQNAVQSIPEDREGTIKVTLYTVEDWVVIEVSDNGTGIPAEIQERIFEPNFTTKTVGTGLGLAISKRIIENVGGEITFRSPSVGEGTEFVIRLKLEKKEI